MKTAIICYDLKHVHSYENIQVKAALATYFNTLVSGITENILSPFLEIIRLTFPDTTLLAFVPDATTSGDLMTHLLEIIRGTGAEPDKVYVAFIDPTTDLLFNSEVKPLLSR